MSVHTHPRTTAPGIDPGRMQAFRRPLRSHDMTSLLRELRRTVRGEVRFDRGSRALYATDSSNYRQPPIGVVVPYDIDDVIATVNACRERDVPVLPRGGGTSLAGQCCNTAVVMDFTKYLHRVLEIDPARRIARVQPGVVLDRLRAEARVHGLTFGPDPATHDHCALGGMIGNNSCGPHSVYAGRTDENVEELTVLRYDGQQLRVGPTPPEELELIIAAGGPRGEIYRRLQSLVERYSDAIRTGFPDIPRAISGYNLRSLLPENGFHVARALVGSEGTCVTILEAVLRLVPEPGPTVLLVLGYPDVFTAADHVPEVMAAQPVAVEALDDVLLGALQRKGLHTSNVALLPDGGGFLLAEFAGVTREEAKRKATSLMQALARGPHPPVMRLFEDPAEQQRIWIVRESGLGATAHVPGMRPTWEGWEDAAVPPERLGGYLREFRALLDRYDYHAALYGHFGQGCVHTRIDFDMETARGVRQFRAFIEDAAELVARYGGSLSGEHGDGQSRGALLTRMFSPELMQAFREFRSIWDPQGRMNPGKLIDARPPDANLLLGPGLRTLPVQTTFRYPGDGGSFRHAALRCVGVGECRREHGGTMCPSYRATREEMHSTRGRARLLFEMLRGDVIEDGWRSNEVKEALDLCLACKACRHECPVQVDMATYKAEFFAHHYAGRLRPRAAYAMGLIHWWARLASRMPGVANFVGHAPVLSRALKWAAGIAPERQIPMFARETFRDSWSRREPRHGLGAHVLLWPDTFNNHFFPDIPKAATAVLEAAGFEVRLPERTLCCGRPLYDFGMLDRAKHQLREILDALRPEIVAGTPVVGLEPSCVAVFRDELTNLFPDDEDAARLSRQVWMLGEFLDTFAPDFTADKLNGHAGRTIVHGHCHHRSVLDFDADVRALRRVAPDLEVLDSGCCGMAGSFGFERDKYEVSQACAEHVLLPAIRAAGDDAIIIADGFSCRQQIEQNTGRRALHLAEVYQAALAGQGGSHGNSSSSYRGHSDNGRPRRMSAAVLGLVGLAVGTLLGWTALRH